MTAIQRTEGIVLHTLSYRDYDQILTVFTREAGVIKLVMRGGLSPRRQGRGSATA
jgi:DNA repair protein RecO (recombination protein O)